MKGFKCCGMLKTALKRSRNRAMKGFNYCKMLQRALNRSRREGEEPKMEARALERSQSAGEEPKMEKRALERSRRELVKEEKNQEKKEELIMPFWNNKKKFDVFLSHRGCDTMRNFTDHMYDLLLDKGLEVFLGKEERQSEERFPEATEEAISCSKVHICILSSEYAESAWRLKALEMMLDMYEMQKSMLIPVFYDVDPLEIRHLKGAFGQGFQKLLDKGRHSEEVIDKWRCALCKIADISGYRGKREHCMTIVNTICTLLNVVGALPSSARVVGRREELSSIIHDVMTYRENGLGVTSVEISGIGGIGKTTFAKELYDQICTQYERSCFIEDARGLVEKHGINEVHRHLIGKLFNYGPSCFTMEEKKLLKDRLHNADILVVIDNIDSTIPLSTIFFEDDVYLWPTSTIIVTSREDGVLKHDPEVANYCKNLISLKISNLDFHTSKQLFLQYAFGGIDHVNNEFDAIINMMVQKCHGLPLALALLGTQVYGKEIKFWEDLYYSLNDHLTPDLQQILEVSYNNLTELEKCLFLDVATFFRWEKVDYLLKLRQPNHEDGKSELLEALDILKKKLLIEIKEGGFLNMHDMLVDLGRSIIKDEDVCPGRRSRVWHPADVRHMLSYKAGTSNVGGLILYGTDSRSPVLDVDEHGDPRPWPADAFGGMSSLKFLLLDGDCIEGDLSRLPRTLEWLRWTNFPYLSMPPTLCLKRVRVLELSGSPLTRSLNPKLPANLQGLLMSWFCRRGPNANSLFTNIFIPLMLYLFLLTTPGPWQRLLPQ